MTQEPPDDDDARHRANMAVLGVAVGIVVLAVFLMWFFKRETDLQDCLWASHRNCDTVSVPSQ